MLDFAEINLGDKALFDLHLKNYNPQASELTFTNLFMWRGYYRIRYTLVNGMLCIVSVPLDSPPFAFMPVGMQQPEVLKDTVYRLKEYFDKNGWQLRFSRLDENETIRLKEASDFEYDVVLDRNNSDYLYSSDDLVFLRGKKYDGKRNHINKFNKLYESEYIVMNGTHIGECNRIMEEWCAKRSCDDHKTYYCEKLANLEALNNFSLLGFKGAMIKVNGRFEAFTIGEMLNSDTAVIHIEKANDGINGLYTLVNQKFAEHQWKEARYINREQDLGVEGLRKSKLSYNPVKLINKYIATVL